MFQAGHMVARVEAVVNAARLAFWRRLDWLARAFVAFTTRRLAGGVRHRKPVHSEAYKKGALVPLKWWISTADRN